jgi:hypothetical protein
MSSSRRLPTETGILSSVAWRAGGLAVNERPAIDGFRIAASARLLDDTMPTREKATAQGFHARTGRDAT